MLPFSLEDFCVAEPVKTVEEFTAGISNSVALRVYSSTRPYNLKIGQLQKGLVFVHEGLEQVGEGGGFGLPILIYKDETYFSGSSIVQVGRNGLSTIIYKEFSMNRVSRTSFKNLHIHNLRARNLMKRLSELYQNNKCLQSLAIRELSLNLGIESVYLKTPTVAKLLVTYEIRDHFISVKVDCRDIKRKLLEKIVVLNEQSAKFFRIYMDSEERKLDSQIPAWERVTSPWACLINFQRNVGYRLWTIDKSSLHSGRETMHNFLDWTGLDYEFFPHQKVFEYKIQLLGVNS